MTKDRLAELLSKFPERRIIVAGDYFLDKYLDFDPVLAEVSLETGKVANQVVNVRRSAGAAGTVINNMVALGAGEVISVGFTGDDGEGYDLRKCLYALGCDIECLLTAPERLTPTYLKPRDIRTPGLEGERERYDTKNRLPLPDEMERGIIKALRRLLPGADAVIIADQVEEEGIGVLTAGVRTALAEMAAEYPGVVFWVDSRCRIGDYRNAIIKPNQHEAVKAVFPDYKGEISDDLAVKAGNALRALTGRPVFLTRAEHGILVLDGGECQSVRGVRIEGPTDPTGAGDSASAAAVLTLASGGSLVEAALMANLVASITVQQLGVTGTASPGDLPARLQLWHDQGY